MEQNIPNKNPINAPIQSMVDGARRDGTAGPLIGSIIIILIILVGGLYFWGSMIVDRKNEIEMQESLEEQVSKSEIEAETTAIIGQSTSDDSASIEADLNATDIDSVDADIEAVDSEY